MIQTISIDDISKNLLDISVPPDGVVDEWKFVDRTYNSLIGRAYMDSTCFYMTIGFLDRFKRRFSE